MSRTLPSLSVYTRPQLKPTAQERMNLDRTNELYPPSRETVVLSSRATYNGDWKLGLDR